MFLPSARFAHGFSCTGSQSSFRFLLHRTLKQLQSLKVTRTRLSQAQHNSSRSKTKLLYCFAAVPSFCGALNYLNPVPFSKLFPTAQCKSIGKNRLLNKESVDEEKKKDPKFQWKLFFDLLYKDIFYLLGAVLVIVLFIFTFIQ